jgi:hypothetical protein
MRIDVELVRGLGLLRPPATKVADTSVPPQERERSSRAPSPLPRSPTTFTSEAEAPAAHDEAASPKTEPGAEADPRGVQRSLMARLPTALERVVAGDAMGPRPSLGALAGAAAVMPSPTAVLETTSPPARPPRVAAGVGRESRKVAILDVATARARRAGEAGNSLDGRKRAVATADDGELVLTRGENGALHYDSSHLRATIAEDGTVTFFARPDARPVVGPFGGNGKTAHQNAVGDPTLAEIWPPRREPRSPGMPAGLWEEALLSGDFDVNSTLLRLAGTDPLDVEKRCFLADTQALREQMSQAHRERTVEEALGALDVRLARLIADPSLAAADKKRAVLDLWDDCALDDAGGRRARRVIVAFVRESMPPGSTLAFNDEELAAFNAGRPADECFAPYG